MSVMELTTQTRDKVRDRLLGILGSSSSFPSGIHFAVDSLLRLETATREMVYGEGERLALSDAEAAFNFFVAAPDFLDACSPEELGIWIDLGLDLYDEQGEAAAREFFSKFNAGVIEEVDRRRGLQLKDVARVLGLYVEGLAGRPVPLQGAPEPYTDIRSLFLPASLHELPVPEDNFSIYKVMATHMYGQMKHGSFDLRLDRIPAVVARLRRRYRRRPSPEKGGLENFLELFPNSRLAGDIFKVIEDYRVELAIRREFPGLAADLDRVGRIALVKRPQPASLSGPGLLVEGLLQGLMGGGIQGAAGKLRIAINKSQELVRGRIGPRSGVEDSAGLTLEIYFLAERYAGTGHDGLEPVLHRGRLRPDLATETVLEAEARLKEMVRDAARELSGFENQDPDAENRQDATLPFGSGRADELEETGRVGRREQDNFGAGGEYLVVERRLLDPPDDLVNDVMKMLDDLGEISSEKLKRSLELAGRRFKAKLPGVITEEQVEMTAADTAGARLYDEWDHGKGRYRRNWCALREQALTAGDGNFVKDTLKKYSGMVTLLRRQFELLKVDNRLLKRQKEGEEVDIDALVEAIADIRAGVTPSEQLYIKTDRRERNIAVAFLVDLSGSTAGWVLDCEKEALVLMCEALQQLKDSYGIFGFSGNTRKQCDFYVVKDFGDSYGSEIKSRIGGMAAMDYTRMGPPIRHLTRIMEQVEARTRLMVILSDGKPEDYDEYRGKHGIEDTRRALIEARQKNIKAFCITIDEQAPAYISHMYGEAHYIILSDVAQLPARLPEIYRRLTT